MVHLKFINRVRVGHHVYSDPHQRAKRKISAAGSVAGGLGILCSSELKNTRQFALRRSRKSVLLAITISAKIRHDSSRWLPQAHFPESGDFRSIESPAKPVIYKCLRKTC